MSSTGIIAAGAVVAGLAIGYVFKSHQEVERQIQEKVKRRDERMRKKREAKHKRKASCSDGTQLTRSQSFEPMQRDDQTTSAPAMTDYERELNNM